jgi:hypothetical protein
VLIKDIESNVKCGVSANDMGPVVLIVGDNMKGKTSFAESVKIGLEGRSSIYGGTPSQMMHLAKDGEDKLFVKLGLLNGSGTVQTSSLSVEGSIVKASKPVRDFPVSALVLDSAITEIMSKEPKRQREAFLRLIAPKGILKDARKSVPAAFQAKWDALVSEVRKEDENMPDADTLVSLAELIREKTRKARAVMKADGAVPETARPTKDALDLLSVEAGAAVAFTTAQQKRAAAAARSQILADELKTLPQPADLGDGPSVTDIASLLPLLKSAIEVNTFLRGIKAKTCPVCACPEQQFSPELALDKLKATEARLLARRDALQKAVPANVLAKMKELSETAALLEGALPPEPKRPLGEVEGELQTLHRAESAWAAYESAHKLAIDAQAEETALVALGKTCERVVAEVLQASVATFEKAASGSLPDGWRFKLKLFEGKKAVCEAGLEIPAALIIGTVEQGNSIRYDFRPWDALSGAQKAAALAGLADAWAQKEIADVKVIVIDEVWIGPDMMRGLLEGLVKIVGKTGGLTQAFVCARDVTGVAPVPGVTLVRLP